MPATLLCRLLVAAIPLAPSLAQAAPPTWIACPAGATDPACKDTGNLAIQKAVDRASDGDTVLVKAGTYAPEAFRDVRYKIHTIRGYVVIENKDVTLVGEAGTVLDGSTGQPATGIVVHGGNVILRNFTIRNFRVASPEDDLYDGHGVFVIDAHASLSNVTLGGIRKMALTVRGTSAVEADSIRIHDGHVGIWMEESSHLRLCRSILRDNDSAGVAAYANASAKIYNSIFDANRDDGIYAAGEAIVYVTNSIITRNKPYGIRGVDGSRIWASHSFLFANEKNVSTATNNSNQLRLGPNVFESDPKVDGAYRPLTGSLAASEGNPDVRDPDGSTSEIGLCGGPCVAELSK